ncbi:hypothetical protein ACIPYS_20660 [Kitasatospora sp. NPDC089913]|uniref:hypothetical protein n=1 Tax=Streptomycetaceae TaxID=2062 RepID=UPI000AC1747D|nr:hypothetical protein [Streptomyces sp. TLI_053]
MAGNTKVANRTGLLPLRQHLEYVMSFGLGRVLQEGGQLFAASAGPTAVARPTAEGRGQLPGR